MKKNTVKECSSSTSTINVSVTFGRPLRLLRPDISLCGTSVLHPHTGVAAGRASVHTLKNTGLSRSCQVITVIVINDFTIYQSSKILTNKANNEKAHVSQRKSK